MECGERGCSRGLYEVKPHEQVLELEVDVSEGEDQDGKQGRSRLVRVACLR